MAQGHSVEYIVASYEVAFPEDSAVPLYIDIHRFSPATGHHRDGVQPANSHDYDPMKHLWDNLCGVPICVNRVDNPRIIWVSRDRLGLIDGLRSQSSASRLRSQSNACNAFWSACSDVSGCFSNSRRKNPVFNQPWVKRHEKQIPCKNRHDWSQFKIERLYESSNQTLRNIFFIKNGNFD